MNNYRYYGNRRYASGDCGCNSQPQKPSADCGCNPPQKPSNDCGCNSQPQKPAADCGCNSQQQKPAADCGCNPPQKPDYGCTIGTLDRQTDKGFAPDLPGKSIAMAYVPWQEWKELYEVCEGFAAGTIFKQLNLDFLGRRCN